MVASIVVTLNEIQIIERLRDDQFVSLEEATASDTAVAVVSVLYLVCMALCIVAYCVWIYQVYSNLPAFGLRDTQFTPGWAVGWYFIPFANLVRPYQVMAEIWRGSEPDGSGIVEGWKQRSVSPLIGWWWATYLIAGLLGTLGFPGSFTTEFTTYDEWIEFNQLFIAGDVAYLVSCLFVALVVWKVTERQEARMGFPDR